MNSSYFHVQEMLPYIMAILVMVGAYHCGQMHQRAQCSSANSHFFVWRTFLLLFAFQFLNAFRYELGLMTAPTIEIFPILDPLNVLSGIIVFGVLMELFNVGKLISKIKISAKEDPKPPIRQGMEETKYVLEFIIVLFVEMIILLFLQYINVFRYEAFAEKPLSETIVYLLITNISFILLAVLFGHILRTTKVSLLEIRKKWKEAREESKEGENSPPGSGSGMPRLHSGQ